MKKRMGSTDIEITVLLAIGYVYGSFMALVVSYTNNRSVLWAIFHSVLSWIYVLYHSVMC